MAERIDIQINDKVSPDVNKKILEIADSAERAHTGLSKLKMELNNLDTGALTKLANASAKMTNAIARETKAKATLIEVGKKAELLDARIADRQADNAVKIQRAAAIEQAANNKTAESNARLQGIRSLANQKLESEMMRTQILTTKYQADIERLTVAQNNAQRSALLLAKAMGQASGNASGASRSFDLMNASQKKATSSALLLGKAVGQAGYNAMGASRSFDIMNRSVRKIEPEAKRASFSLRGMLGTMTTFFGLAFTGRAIVGFVDSFSNLENKLKLVTHSTRQLNEVTEEVFAIAKRSRVNVDDTARSFQRFDRAMQGMGRSQKESLRLTETLSKALIISGATVGEQSAGLLQLSQAFNKGKLDGDEFRTVMELLPTVADAIAKEMGVARGELLKLAPQGKITAKILADALSNVADQVDRDFAKIVPTVSSAFTNLQTAAIRALGRIEKATGIFQGFANAILFVGNHIEAFSFFLVTAGTALATAFVPKLWLATEALRHFLVTFNLTPMGLAVTAIVGAVAALTLFSSGTKEAEDKLLSFRRTAEDVATSLDMISRGSKDYLAALSLGNQSEAVNALKKQERGLVSFYKTIGDLDSEIKIGQDVGPEGLVKRVVDKEGLDLLESLKTKMKEVGINTSDFIKEIKKEGSKNLFQSLLGGENLTVDDVFATINKDKLKEWSKEKIALVKKNIEDEQKAFKDKEIMERKKTFAFLKAEMEGFEIDLTRKDLTKAQVEAIKTIREENKAVQDQLKLKQSFGNALTVETNLSRILNDLKKEGVTLDNEAVELQRQFMTAKLQESIVLDKMNDIYKANQGAVEDLGLETQALNRMFAQGKISTSVYEDGLKSVGERLEELRMKQSMTSEEFKRSMAIKQAVKDLDAQYGGSLDQLKIKEEALNRALQDKIITLQQYNLESMKLGVQMVKHQLAMGQKGGLEDIMTTSMGRIVENYSNGLTSLSSMFGNFFSSMNDGFADSIGRAIVMGDDLEESLKNVAKNGMAELISSFVKLGVQMVVQDRLRSVLSTKATAENVAQASTVAAANAPAAATTSLASFGTNAIAAVAGIGAVLAAMKMLGGFKSGGYTGNIGTSEVAGVVHGREFVMNADATARNRDVLEAMNRGQSISSVGGNVTALNVTVENYGSSQISVEQISATDVRIIARDVASNTVRQEAPGVIAADISNPNSRVSKSLAQNTNTTRKR